MSTFRSNQLRQPVEISGSLIVTGSVNITGSLTLNGNAIDRPYKVYTALLTQSGGDNPLTTGNLAGGPAKDIDSIQKGQTYEITANPNNTDLSVYGAPNNLVGTKFVSSITANLSDDNLDVDVIFSLNTGAPIVTVLENTIGNVWFEYNDMGDYSAKSDTLFTNNKTVFFIGSGATAANLSILQFRQFNESQAYIVSGDIDGSLYDNQLSKTPIEIRVYN